MGFPLRGIGGHLGALCPQRVEITVKESAEQQQRRRILGLSPAAEEPEQTAATGAFVQAMEDEFQEVCGGNDGYG